MHESKCWSLEIEFQNLATNTKWNGACLVTQMLLKGEGSLNEVLYKISIKDCVLQK
jgi:hypothetical protein